MKDRINQIIQREGLTAAQFAEKIGISASSLSHVLRGRNNPSLELILKIRNACSYVNSDWLLEGKGEMENAASDIGNRTADGVSLFDENPLFPPILQDDAENRKEMEVEKPIFAPKEIVREEIKYIEKPARKITEIRIFFDNGTYETFHPDK